MKKKLVSVLLALALCGSLVVPVFAEPAEEPPTPEESEVLTGEVAQDLPDLSMENGESEVTEEAEFTYGHLHCLEEVVEEDGTTWQYGYQCSDVSCPYLQNMQMANTPSETLGEPYIVCRKCNDFNWGPEEFYKIEYYNTTGNPNTHKERLVTIFYCLTTLCGGYVTKTYPNSEEVAHSWNEKIKYQSNNAVNHTVEHNYSCKCGATKTESETESHSLQIESFTGNHHHIEGTKRHTAEYRYTCSSGCGYSTTKWDIYDCPGGNGGSCLYPNSLDEEELMGGVTGPEDVMELDETTEPAEEPPAPEETTPLEVVAPEENEEGDTSDLDFFQQVMAMVGGLDIELDVDEEDTALDLEFYHQVMAMVDELDIELDADVMDAENSNTHICVAEYDEDKDYIGLVYRKINGDTKQHKVYKEYMGHCVGCKNPIIAAIMIGTENHSFRKGSLAYCRQVDADVHEAMYAYSCRACGMTVVGEWETESHSLQIESFTGNHHHIEGTKRHTAEYRYTCSSGCGYSTTKWDIYDCPGGNGGSCLYPNSLDEEELMGDVTLPAEAAALPENVTGLEEPYE